MLEPDQVQYDVVSGVSAGAINALAISTFPKGSEPDMVKYMLNMWSKLHSEFVYKSWDYFGIFRGLFYEKGIYDSSPLAKMLEEIVVEN